MHKLQLHIRNILLVMLVACAGVFGQVLEENYNTGSINQRKTDCWLFDDFEIDNSNPINSGGDRKHGATDGLSGGWFLSGARTAGTSTPFIKFDGTGYINFKHKADEDDYDFLGGAYLQVKLIDPYNNQATVFTHVYKQVSFFNSRPNGNPENVQNESIRVTWSGYYRVEWEWVDYSSAYTEYFIDDISVPLNFDPIVEREDVCMDATVDHTPADVINAGAPNDFEYSWSWVGTPGGTLTTQTANDRTARVDWNVGPGNYRLRGDETYDNGSCSGRTFYIDVTVRQQPTYTVSIDTVCEENRATISISGAIGRQPYTVRYDDGNGPINVVTAGASLDRQLSLDATEVDIISVTDADGCEVDPATLGVFPITYFPKPTTGPIYHN